MKKTEACDIFNNNKKKHKLKRNNSMKLTY